MPRKARSLLDGKELRKAFDSQGIKYVMVNNKIIDLYKVGYYENGEEKIKFDARNLTIYIGMLFLDRIEFNGYIDEVASFIGGMSAKRIKDRLLELEKIKLPMNNKFSKAENKNHLLDGPVERSLIKIHKERGFERNRTVKTSRWYTPFDCDLVKKNNELQAHKFFMVTIYDFDLFLKGILDEHEFALYLYLIQCFNSGDTNKKGIAQSASKIAGNMRVKNTDVMQRRLDKLTQLRVTDIFCDDKYKDFPLIYTQKPANYNTKLTTRKETSLYYYPVYNDKTLERLQNEPIETEDNKDTDSNKLDSENNVDTDSLIPDTDSYNMDADNLF